VVQTIPTPINHGTSALSLSTISASIVVYNIQTTTTSSFSLIVSLSISDLTICNFIVLLGGIYTIREVVSYIVLIPIITEGQSGVSSSDNSDYSIH
jgi:hypothetical protein